MFNLLRFLVDSHARFRHIDCAKAYQNQTGLGQALQDLYKDGKVSRKDFWLTTKLWNTDHAEVRKNCLESMKELQTDYLDLYLVHWPVTPHKGSELTPSMKVSCSHALPTLVSHTLSTYPSC